MFNYLMLYIYFNVKKAYIICNTWLIELGAERTFYIYWIYYSNDYPCFYYF